MKDTQMTSNSVLLSGQVASEPTFSHESFGEGFYEVKLLVPRLSDNQDIIPVTVSEKLMTDGSFAVGKNVAIKGQFRSYNKMVDGKSRLMLTVFAREVIEYDKNNNPNTIELVGYLCKAPVYRTTPFKREICDILIAVNRAYNKSDYLPCIAWGRNARYVKNAKIGTKIEVVGRIQSRAYQKRFEDGSVTEKVAYEISISKVFAEDLPVIIDKMDDDEIDIIGY